MVLGDFNDRCKDWNTPHIQREIGDKLSNLLYQSNLYQMINEPTRSFSNQLAILDLIITDSPHLLLGSGVSVTCMLFFFLFIIDILFTYFLSDLDIESKQVVYICFKILPEE